MKLTIDRMSLLRPLGHVQSVVERRNTIPILANVVLEARNGTLAMTATDMDMDIATEVGSIRLEHAPPCVLACIDKDRPFKGVNRGHHKRNWMVSSQLHGFNKLGWA